MPDSETDIAIRNEIALILHNPDDYSDLYGAIEEVLLSYGVELDYLADYLG